MSRNGRPVVLLGMVLLIAGICLGQEPADDRNERLTAERFMLVLEKNPRRGTAFDKVYGYHVERGSLDAFVKKYRDAAATAAGPGGASAAMILGLIESQRGNDAEAIRAFTKAETLDPASAMASYCLGQTLVLTGRSEEAAAAFERAIQRKPAPVDLLEVFQALGRVYQRSQKNDKALDVWNRLEQQFPNDPRVQEQIATTLLEENDLDGALPRFEALVRSTKDKYRQSLFQVEAAEIKVRLGKTTQALADFEGLLKQLNPENWLFRDIRRRIETVFLRGNDQAGLIAYYQTWISKNPEDLDAVSRLARILSGVGRSWDAQVWLQQGLKQAPSNKELRSALIVLLLSQQKYHTAVEQYQEQDKHAPNNPDTLRDWGRALLKDSTQSEEDRKQAAAVVWRRLLTVRSKDAHAALQVAELFRHAGMTTEAIEMYRRGMQLAPESVQYHEYLGEYLHSLKRTDEALAVWRDLATGSRKTATNVARLAEVLSRHGQLAEAIEANAEACRLDPKDLNLQFKQADLLSRADKHEESLQKLSLIGKLVATDEEREAWLQRQLAELNALDRLKTRIAEVRQELAADSAADKAQIADRWYWLSRAEEVAGQPRTALQDIAKATALNPNSVPILTAAARLNEAQRNLRVAVEMNTKLAAINRRSRTEYLKRIMVLEEKLGHREPALQAGRDLMSAAPGNPELSDQFSQLCFRQGCYDEGIQILRRSLRTNPGDVATLMKLAAVLGNHSQTAEAIELLWRAFERSHTLDERLGVVQQLAEAYSKTRQLNPLYIRLERERRDPALHREMTLCLARAYETIKDYANAQHKLETLLTEDTRDTELLTHLRVLAERQNNLVAAIKFQRQLWQISNLKADRFHLAQLLLQSGQHDDAVDLLTAESGAHELTPDALRLLDALQNRSKRVELAARLGSLRKRFPDNWELLYREGVALGRSSPAAAMERFEAIVKLDRPEDEPSILGKPVHRNSAQQSPLALPLVERLAEMPLILQTAQQAQQNQPNQFGPQGSVNGRVVAPTWVPRDYGMARLAAWCWLVNLHRETGKVPIDDLLEQRFPQLDQPLTRQQCIDQFIAYSILGNNFKRLASIRKLMQLSEDDIEARIVFLKSVLERHGAGSIPGLARNQSVRSLDNEALDEALSIYREIAARPELKPHNVLLLPGMMAELTAAKRETVAALLQLDVARNITTPVEYLYMMSYQQRSPDLAVTAHLLDRLMEMQDRSVGGQQYFNIDQLPHSLLNQYHNSSSSNEMLEVWKRYVRIYARELANRTAKPAPRTQMVAQTQRIVSTNQLTRTIVNARPELPSETPAFIYSAPVTTILLLMHRQFEFSKRSDELISIFQTELKQAEERTAEERLLWQHALAYLLWVNNKRDTALEILTQAADESPSRKELRLGLALQYELAKRPATALTMLDLVTVDSPAEQRELSKMVLRLAIAAGDLERAKVEIERLSDAVPPEEVETMAGQLLQLGLPAKAEALLAAAPDPSAARFRPERMRLMMEIQLAQGKNDEASATANNLLELLEHFLQQRENVEQLQAVNGRLVPVEVSRVGLIQQCYKVLRATGRLAEMIETAEKRLEESPDSERMVNRLISLHTAVANQPRIDELVTLKLKLNADKPASRYALAMRYVETGKSDAALEQFKILCERDPADFVNRCRETLNLSRGKKQLPEFVTLLGQIDWGKDKKCLAALPSLVDQLCHQPATAEAAEQLFVQLWEARPERHVDMLVQFNEDRWWQLKQVRDSYKSILIPQSAEGVADQWKIFGRVMRRDSSETNLITVWNRILSDFADKKNLDLLAADVEQGIKQWPDWTAGRVMLAMIDLRRERVNVGRDVLDKLFPELDQRLQAQPMIAWEIGQELIHHKQALDVGVKYISIAIRRGGPTDWMSASSPGRVLIDSYAAADRLTDARKLLLDSVPSTIRRDANPKVIPATGDIMECMSIGRKLRTLNCPMDAIEVYLTALQRTEHAFIGGYDPRVEIQSSLVIAFGELKPESLVKYLEEFDNTTRQLTLPLFVRQTDPSKGRMQGRWDAMLINIAKDAALLARTQSALDRISKAEPDKVAPLVIVAQLQLAAGDMDKAAAAVTALVQFVDKHPLSQESDPLKEAVLQHQSESGQLALWLVARECLSQPALAKQGEVLAQRAVEVSRPISQQNFAKSILMEWLRIATAAGDSATITRLKEELARLP